jgi:hypothetical protein
VALAERGGVAKLPRTVAVTVKVRSAPVTVTGMTGTTGTLDLTTDIGAIAVKVHSNTGEVTVGPALPCGSAQRSPALLVR